MRATTHNGRANKNEAYRASHNDRKFNLDKAEHIDQDKTKKKSLLALSADRAWNRFHSS